MAKPLNTKSSNFWKHLECISPDLGQRELEQETLTAVLASGIGGQGHTTDREPSGEEGGISFTHRVVFNNSKPKNVDYMRSEKLLYNFTKYQVY